MAKIDSTKSAILNLLALVSAANSALAITPSQVTAGTPAVKTDTGDGRNTNVTLTAVGGQGFTGSQTYAYTRRGLNDSVLSPVDSTTQVIGATAEAIVTALAAQLGLVESEVHLEDPAAAGTPLTGAISNSPATLNLVSAAGSLLYIDASSQAIAFTWTEPTLDLATATPNTDLAGFDAAS